MPELTRAQWLERRRQYIGGSDAAAALGLSPWTSRYQLWQDKMGQAADIPSAVMERGTLLEAVVAELYRRRTGHEIDRAGWCKSPDHYWMAATPDLIDLTEDSICQIKTHSNWQRHRWGDADHPNVPDHEAIQCQHEMAVTGSRVNNLLVLFADEAAFRGMAAMAKGGFRPEAIADHVEELIADGMAEFLPTIRIERDDDTIAGIIEGERQFWEAHVLTKEPPADASVPQTSTDILDADDEQTEVLTEMRELKSVMNDAQEKYEECCVKIETAIGEHSGIVAKGIAKVSYKAPKAKKAVDWASVASTLAEWQDVDVPQPETWESIAKTLGLDAGDDLFNTALEMHTATVQPKRTFRPKFYYE